MKGVRPVCPVLSRFSVGGNVLDAPLRSQRSLSASCVLTRNARISDAHLSRDWRSCHRGHYPAEKRMVRVDNAGSSKATQLGGSPPQVLARLLLSELVRKHQD